MKVKPRKSKVSGLPQPAPLAIGRRKAAELDQAGLVRMQRQRKLPEPLAHRVPEATGVALVLKADDQVSGAGGSHPRALAEPYVTLAPHPPPIVSAASREQGPMSKQASLAARDALRASGWLVSLCRRKDLNFRSAHRAKKTSMRRRVG